MKFTLKIGIVLTILFSAIHSFAQISPKEIKYWVGSGADTAYLAIDFVGYTPASRVWGYLYDGNKTVTDLLNDVNTADAAIDLKVTTEIDSIYAGPWTKGNNTDTSTWNVYVGDLSLAAWTASDVTASLVNGTVYGTAFNKDEPSGATVPTPATLVVYMETPLYHDASIENVKFFVGEGDLTTVILVDFKNPYLKKSLAFGVNYTTGETLKDALGTIATAYDDFSFDAATYLNGITFDTLSSAAPASYFSIYSNDLTDNLGSFSNSGLSQVIEEDFYYSFVISGGHTANDLRPVFSPAAEEQGTQAIAKDSSVIVAWASGVSITRGFIQIDDESKLDKGVNTASYGEDTDAEGTSAGVVSLGDAGVALVTFDTPIANGEGADFAIFENSFSSVFLELAFVEVSSDGVNFFRFPSVSLTDTSTQIGSFGSLDPKNLYNLAGSFKKDFGTPFDLEDLKGTAGLDLDAITHVKIIDVIGTIDPQFASKDSQGNIVNDPYPTAFWSGGFDLDGIAVLNENKVAALSSQEEKSIQVYPNPAISTVHISLTNSALVSIYNMNGAVVYAEELSEGTNELSIETIGLTSGMYFVQTAEGVVSKLIIK